MVRPLRMAAARVVIEIVVEIGLELDGIAAALRPREAPAVCDGTSIRGGSHLNRRNSGGQRKAAKRGTSLAISSSRPARAIASSHSGESSVVVISAHEPIGVRLTPSNHARTPSRTCLFECRQR